MRTLFQSGGDLPQYLENLSESGALTAGLNWYRANIGSGAAQRATRATAANSAPTMGVFSTGDLYLAEDAMVRVGRVRDGAVAL